MTVRQRPAKKCPWFVAGISHNGAVLDAGATRTVLASENGRMLIATAANNFTLPALTALEIGTQFIFQQIADANMVITSAAGNDIIVLGDAAASTITFSTTNEKIGSCVQLEVIDSDGAGTKKWVARNLGGSTMTIA